LKRIQKPALFEKMPVIFYNEAPKLQLRPPVKNIHVSMWIKTTPK